MIAISGASGHLGQRLLQLTTTQVRPGGVIALTRSPERLAPFAEQGVRVEQGDFDAPDALSRTLTGVEQLVLIPTAPGPNVNRLEQHLNAVHAAAKAGVRHVIYISSLNPNADNLLTGDHAQTEEALEASGVSWTFLRMGWYMENLLPDLQRARSSGTLTAVRSAPLSYVARDDVAAAAAAVLTTANHEGRRYDITGPAALIQEEVAEAASAALGKPVRFTELSFDQLREILRSQGQPDEAFQGYRAVLEVLQGLTFSTVSEDFMQLTRREAEGLSTFLKSHMAKL